MPSYEIHYRDELGNNLETFWVPCNGPKQAKILAHAMRPRAARRIEVWEGEALIYQRPENLAAVPDKRDLHSAA